MEKIKLILTKRMQGIECTASEIATIKEFIRTSCETFYELWDEVVKAFPVEYKEVMSETGLK
jgi:hypothetical protein